MIKQIILTILAIISLELIHLGAFAQNEEYQTWVDSATVSYNNQQFDKAAMFYEQVLNHGISSADLHYNLGNAYYKQGMLAKSILHFEKALKYNPSHDDAKFNLELATNAITDRISQPTEPFYQRWYKQLWQSMPVDSWAYISIAGFGVLIITILLFIFTSSITLKKILLPTSALSLLLLLSTLKLGSESKNYQMDTGMGVVFEYSLNVKSAPDDSGTDLFTIHEGLKIEIIEVLGDWSRISIADGRIGWIPSDSFQKI